MVEVEEILLSRLIDCFDTKSPADDDRMKMRDEFRSELKSGMTKFCSDVVRAIANEAWDQPRTAGYSC